MKNSIKLFLLCSTILVLSVLPATAQLATLAWDQNTQPEVIGYRVYYQIDAPTFPFNGTTLSEGVSPIIVDGASTTSLTIDLPEDGNIYYFTATAVSDNGLESSFSDIIASEWIPFLLAPTNDITITTTATFDWDLPPTGYNVTYELYYGTDPSLNAKAAPPLLTNSNRSNWPKLELNIIIPIVILFSLLLAIRSSRKEAFPRTWNPIRVGLCIGILALQASCGGGGGDSAVGGGVTPASTEVVTGITSTDYQVTNLQPGTQYYWKIVAVDDQGFPYESITQSFVTSAN